MWSILAYLYPVENNKIKTSSFSIHFDKLNLQGLEFPMKVKDMSKSESLNRINTGGQQCGTQSTQSASGAFGVNVLELTGTVLTPIHINKNYLQPEIDLLLYENHYYLITKLHYLINKNSHVKHVCRRCLTAFSSESVLLDHMERCINQQPTNITFSWKDHLKLEDHHMKVNVPIRVYADFECINQSQNDPEVLFKQLPIAVGFL